MRFEDRTKNEDIVDEKSDAAAGGEARAELLALFRLLLKQPPKDHDVRTCPICKRYGITEI